MLIWQTKANTHAASLNVWYNSCMCFIQHPYSNLWSSPPTSSIDLVTCPHACCTHSHTGPGYRSYHSWTSISEALHLLPSHMARSICLCCHLGRYARHKYWESCHYNCCSRHTGGHHLFPHDSMQCRMLADVGLGFHLSNTDSGKYLVLFCSHYRHSVCWCQGCHNGSASPHWEHTCCPYQERQPSWWYLYVQTVLSKVTIYNLCLNI